MEASTPVKENLIQRYKDNPIQLFYDALDVAMKIPRVKINRAQFLRNELQKYCFTEDVEKAIATTPAKAGIKREIVDHVADGVILAETLKISGATIATSLPSAFTAKWEAAVGAAMLDLGIYLAAVLRTAQELAYLYGFEELDFKEDNTDSETMSQIIIMLGVMYGVHGANEALSKIVASTATHVGKRLARAALTNGTIYPIIKSIAKTIGVHMTKQIFADSVASLIKYAGCLASGAITYFSFKPRCKKLQRTFKSYNISDPSFYNIPGNIVIE